MTTTETETREKQVISRDGEFRMLELWPIEESKTNPRKYFAKEALSDLTNSVREKGILVPLLVRPLPIREDGDYDRYEIVAGARRFRAALAAKLKTIPVLIRELTDEQALEVQVIENLQRADVHPLEEAEGYKQLLAKGKYEIADLAAKVGKSESYIYQRLKLAELVPAAKKAFGEEKITAGHAILIARLQPQDQATVLKEGQRYGGSYFSVRDLSHWIQEHIHLKLKAVPWKLEDAELVPKAGACAVCPKRSANNPALFSDICKDDVCMDPSCFQGKMQAHLVRLQSAMTADGKASIVISTTSYKPPAGALSSDKWRRASAGSCEYILTGLVVDSGWHDSRDFKRGDTAYICADKKCKTHWDRSNPHSSPARSWQEKATERKNRALEAARVQALALIAAKIKKCNLNEVAVRLAGRTTFDGQKLACRALGIWPKDGKTGGFDFRGKLELHIKNHESPLDVVLGVLAIIPEYGRWGDGYYGAEEITALRKAGLRAGVNVLKLERQFVKAANDKAKKKAKAKPKKVQTAAKKKAA